MYVRMRVLVCALVRSPLRPRLRLRLSLCLRLRLSLCLRLRMPKQTGVDTGTLSALGLVNDNNGGMGGAGGGG